MFGLIGIVLILIGVLLVMFNRRIAGAITHSQFEQREGLEKSTSRQNIIIVGVVCIVGGILFIFLSWPALVIAYLRTLATHTS